MLGILSSIILITGFSGIVAQILLLRELLVSFYGNELSIGIILSNWLLLEAIGSFLVGKKIEKAKNKIITFVITCLVFSVFFPITIYFARILKLLLGAQFGEGIGIFSIFSSTLLLLVPVCITHGALFTFSCKLYDQIRDNQSGEFTTTGAYSISKVYIYETVGTAIGGIVVTYLLIPYFNSFQIAVFVAIANFLCCVVLATKLNWSGRKIFLCISILLLILSVYFFISNKIEFFHQLSIKNQWEGHNVIDYQNSIYGNVSVVKSGEQYTFFSDGIPVVTTPIPDINWIEDFVHLSMLSHTQPQNILIISGGAGGVISEILKYNSVKKIDYVELDPLILKLIKKFPTDLTSEELSNPKVKIHFTDGRYFIRTTILKYDIVFLGISEPQDLQSNRLFTVEFFDTIKSRLTSDGILVINLPGSLSYLSEELKKLNLCIITTLKTIFSYIKIIPGETNLFLCSDSKLIQKISPELLYSRLTQRKIVTQLLTLKYMEYRLHHRWLEWFFESLQSTKNYNQLLTSLQTVKKSIITNYDFKPIAMFFSISYWNAKFSPYLQQFFSMIEKTNLVHVIILVSIFTLFVVAIKLLAQLPYLSITYSLKSVITRLPVPYIIATTGFVGMIFQLVLIFGFQVLYGYLYYQIGVLITAFMFGLTTGCLISSELLNRMINHIRVLVVFELSIILFSVIIVVILNLLKYSTEVVSILPVLFLMLCFISGFLIGAEFPLGNKIYLQNMENLSATAGLLYASDLLGGWLSGVISSIVFLPVLGLLQTCLIALILKISSFVILVVGLKV